MTTYPKFISVYDYFERNYLGRLDINGRKDPVFLPKYWNYYDDVAEGVVLPRTTNCVEGFHRGMKLRLTHDHPTVAKYVLALKQQQRTTDFELNRLDYGIDITAARKKKKKMNEDSLRTHVLNYSSIPLEQYIAELAEITGYYTRKETSSSASVEQS